MLVVSAIKKKKEKNKKRLKKRKFNKLHIIDEVINVDELSRKTQFELDNLLAESNKLSKEIGELFKQGKAEEANELKEKSTQQKVQTKELQDLLSKYENQVNEILYLIPNIPHDSVVAVKSADHNVEVFKHVDDSPKPNNIPHWDFAKKHNLIDFE